MMDGLWSLRCQNDGNKLADMIGTFIIGTAFPIVVNNGNKTDLFFSRPCYEELSCPKNLSRGKIFEF